MGCCNEPFSPLPYPEQNPTLHVHYTKGMVLGVDDFNQEFAYLANRDQWAVRELVGYGTISGLSVFIEDKDRLHVTQGTAAVPSGKLVCVPEDQCASISKWLAEAKDDEIKPDNNSTLSLYLTLSYRDCKTAKVPILGDPCRSEEQLMAESRIADSHCLELRTKAPVQVEEEALREFVAWLKKIMENKGTTSINIEEWLAKLKETVDNIKSERKALKETTSLPSLELFKKLSADNLLSTFVVSATKKSEFLRLAFLFWVTDLKPICMNYVCNKLVNSDQDYVLLAELKIPVIKEANKWKIKLDNNEQIQVDQYKRPYLASMRLLQEWLLSNFVSSSNLAVLPQSLTKASIASFKGITTTGAVKIGTKIVKDNLKLGADDHCVICSKDVSIELPKAASHKGQVYIIKSQTNATSVVPVGGDTIDGKVNTKTLGLNKSFTLVSDGDKTWHIIEST